MKIEKHAQSCFLLESQTTKILIDLGNLVVHEGTDIEKFKDIDALLLTHKHPDHTDPSAIGIVIRNNPQMKIFTNEEVAAILKERGIKSAIVKEGDEFTIKDAQVKAVHSEHGWLPQMFEGGVYPEVNIGFVITMDGKSIYHTSDTVCYPTEVRNPDVMLIAVSGHGATMEPDVAVEFAQAIGAKLTIPCHYDSSKHPKGSKEFEKEASDAKLNHKALKNGESIEI